MPNSGISLQWRIVNQREVEAALDRWAGIGDQLKTRRVSMGSPLIYAGPINRGFFLTGPRAGRTSRLKGPVLFMDRAKSIVLPLVGPEIAARGRASGPAGVIDAVVELGKKAQQIARRQIEQEGAVRSGNLRNTLGVFVNGQRVA